MQKCKFLPQSTNNNKKSMARLLSAIPEIVIPRSASIRIRKQRLTKVWAIRSRWTAINNKKRTKRGINLVRAYTPTSHTRTEIHNPPIRRNETLADILFCPLFMRCFVFFSYFTSKREYLVVQSAFYRCCAHETSPQCKILLTLGLFIIICVATGVQNKYNNDAKTNGTCKKLLNLLESCNLSQN